MVKIDFLFFFMVRRGRYTIVGVFPDLTVKENPNYQFPQTVIQIWTKLKTHVSFIYLLPNLTSLLSNG